MYQLDKNQKFKIQTLIKQALEEDIAGGDITSNILIPEDLNIKAIILAKEKGVIAGLDVAGLVFELFNRDVQFKPQVRDGSFVKSGTVIARLQGPACGILTAERTALNFLSRLSGIATLTRKLVEKIKPYKVRIMDTRKTTPNLRILEKYAVKLGGGWNHRMGLYDMVLIKDNHIMVKGQGSRVKGLVQEVREKAPEDMKIEIEVKTLGEFREALKSGPDIIMLDNMKISQIKKAVEIRNNLLSSAFKLQNLPKLEISGRVTLKNVRQIAKTGAEMISVGSLTHSVKSLDVSLEVKGLLESN